MDQKIDSYCVQITNDNGSRVFSWSRTEVYKRIPKGTFNTFHKIGTLGEYAGIDKYGGLVTNSPDNSCFNKTLTTEMFYEKIEGTKFDRI